MRKGPRDFIWTLTFLAISLKPAWSQAGGSQTQVRNENEGSVAQPAVDPSPDIAQTNPSNSLSSQPSFDPASPLSPSSITAGLHVSGGPEGDSSGTGNSLQVFPVSSILGSLNLQKLQPRSQTAINYAGGVTFNGNYGSQEAYVEQVHTLDVDHRIVWQKTQLSFEDSFYYLRDGNFGSSSFGGASAYNLRFGVTGNGFLGNPEADFIGATQIPFGQGSLLTNVSTASLSQTLTGRSTIAFGASYSISEYPGDSQSLSDFRQNTMQVSYSYRLNGRDSIGVVYGFQRFQYTQVGVGTITTSSAEFLYRRRLLSRFNLLLGAGPEVARVSGSNGSNGQQLNATAQASLQYTRDRYNLGVSYDRLETGGFGVFAGGNSNIFRLSIGRSISRSCRVNFDSGYAQSTSIETSSPGVPGSGSSYDYVFAGAAVQRQLGPHLSAFASYQFNYETSPCGATSSCAPGLQQHIALIGLDWNIRPIHLE